MNMVNKSYNKQLLSAIVKGKKFIKTPLTRTVTQTESEIQQSCFRWFKLQYPKLAEEGMLFHIANEGIRVGRQGGRAKREGIVRGVADICLAIPNHGYGALYIEMKRPKTFDHKATYQTPDQKAWQAACEKYGNKYVVCRSVEEFKAIITRYLSK